MRHSKEIRRAIYVAAAEYIVDNDFNISVGLTGHGLCYLLSNIAVTIPICKAYDKGSYYGISEYDELSHVYDTFNGEGSRYLQNPFGDQYEEWWEFRLAILLDAIYRLDNVPETEI